MIVRDGIPPPPFVHRMQLDLNKTSPSAAPLANCTSLIRMWNTRVPGSETFIRTTIEAEMNRLSKECSSYSHVDLLASLQAYLLYCLTSYFSTDAEDTAGLRELFGSLGIAALQEIASQVTQKGVVCHEEMSHARPQPFLDGLPASWRHLQT